MSLTPDAFLQAYRAAAAELAPLAVPLRLADIPASPPPPGGPGGDACYAVLFATTSMWSCG